MALIAARGLADDEAGRLERSGEAGESLGRVGDRVGAAAGGVEHDDCGFADVASDEPRWRGGGRHFRLASYEVWNVCRRAMDRHATLFLGHSVPRCGLQT